MCLRWCDFDWSRRKTKEFLLSTVCVSVWLNGELSEPKTMQTRCTFALSQTCFSSSFFYLFIVCCAVRSAVVCLKTSFMISPLFVRTRAHTQLILQIMTMDYIYYCYFIINAVAQCSWRFFCHIVCELQRYISCSDVNARGALHIVSSWICNLRYTVIGRCTCSFHHIIIYMKPTKQWDK